MRAKKPGLPIATSDVISEGEVLPSTPKRKALPADANRNERLRLWLGTGVFLCGVVCGCVFKDKAIIAEVMPFAMGIIHIGRSR